MAVSYDTSGLETSTGTSVSKTITVGSLSSGIMLICCADQNSGDTITTPTIGGSSSGVTLLETQPQAGSDSQCKVFYKLAPTSGSTAVAFTAGSAPLGLVVITFDGVDQITPYRTPGKYSTWTTPNMSATATTIAGDVLAEFFAWYAGGGVVGITYDGSQTQRESRDWATQGIGACTEVAGGTSTAATATLSQDWGVGWSVIAIPLIAAGAGGGGLVNPLSGKFSGLLRGKM